MNKEEAKLIVQNIDVIRAWVDGKTVQVHDGEVDHAWVDYNGTCANFSNLNWKWRVKPEPREWWIVEDLSGVRVCHVDPKIPDNFTARAFHVREVTP